MINIVFEQDKDDVLSSGDLIDLKTIDTFLVTSFFETNLLSLFSPNFKVFSSLA